MSQHADESGDRDPLLEFENEPKTTPPDDAEPPASGQLAEALEVAPPPPPPASSEAINGLNERLDRLERALETSVSQLSSLGSEVATLVGRIDDIRKNDSRSGPTVRSPRRLSARALPPRAGSAVAAVIIGIATILGVWALWSREAIDARSAAAQPVAVDSINEPSQPTLTLASAPTLTPAPSSTPPRKPLPSGAPPDRPGRDSPVRTAAERLPARSAYVGTLSIDSEPAGEVFINRKPAGHTPLRVANLKAGSHLVWIERDGYRRFTRVVQVPADRVSRLSASLESLAAR